MGVPTAIPPAVLKDGPAIAPEGVSCAELLAQTLAAAKVQTIITRQYRRTQETAAPLAQLLGIKPVVTAVRRGALADHISEVIAEVNKASGAVLVVGHSNTVAAIVAGLSSSRPSPLCETSFANLFIVMPAAPSLPAIQLKLGKPDAAPTADCQ